MAKRGDRIHRRNDGRWEGRIKIGSYQNGKTKYKSLYGKTYREVKEKMKQYTPASNDYVSTECKNLDDIIYFWINNSNINRKKSSVHKYESVIKKHISPVIGNIPCTDFDSTVFNSFLAQKLLNGRIDGKGGLSPSYVRTIALIIQSSINFGAKEGKCPDMKIKLTKPQIEKKDIKIIDKKSYIILENELCENTDPTKLGILISLQTGLRIGEICSLSWDDIDLENNIIHIKHTVSRVADDNGNKTKLIIDSPKTKTSVRDIPISSTLRPFLICGKQKAKSKYVVSDCCLYVSPRTYYYRYQKLLRKCGLPSFNYHSIRHTFATRCIETGMDVKTLSELLGHSGVNITLNTYVHPSWDLKREQIEKLSDYNTLPHRGQKNGQKP